METKYELMQKLYDRDHEPSTLEYYTSITGIMDCNVLCRTVDIAEKVIEENLNKFDMEILCSCQRLSCDFLKRHFDKIHWGTATKTQLLDDDIIMDILHDERFGSNKYILKNLIQYQSMNNVNTAIAFSKLKKSNNVHPLSHTLSSEIVSNIIYYDNYEGKDGTINCIPRKFSLDMIELLANDINWTFISKNIQLPEYFINKYKNKVHWGNICRYQELSEEFLVSHVEYLVWDNVWRYQKLNEGTIKVLSDLDAVSVYKWKNISRYQKLSEDFIRQHYKEVDWEDICTYQKLSEEFIEEFSHKVKWDAIYKYQYISGLFIHEHYDKFKFYIL